MKKRTMIFVTAMVLLFAMVTGSTIAYMTSKPTAVINTFTYGSVVIALDEKDVDDSTDGAERDTANSYHLYPGKEYEKDPTVHVGTAKEGNASSENCYLFVKVVNPITAIEDSAATIEKQMDAKGWEPVEGQTGVYYYDGKTQKAGDTTATVSNGESIVVFEHVKVATDADLSKITNGAEVKIRAYAIQAEGFNTAKDAWDAAPLTDWGI